MQLNNYAIFCDQLTSVIQKYPSLRIKEVDSIKYLKGIIDIPNDDKEIVGSFSIELFFTNGFPYRFPILKEVGGDIPNVADWHKYTNDACCITVEPNEILICKNGISVLFFIENYAIPYFANYIHKLRFKTYKNGEYTHGFSGIKQFYSDLFKTTDKNKWVEYLRIVFKNNCIHISRNDKCFCGSNIKFKHCHEKVFHQMRNIGINQIINDLKKI